MANVLAYAETRDGNLRPVALEVVSAARALADSLGGQVHAVVLGPSGMTEAARDLARFGADQILVAEADAYRLYAPDAATRAVSAQVNGGDYAAVLFPASAQGKDLAPRIAARLDCGLATEVTEIDVEDGRPVVVRPCYGGKAYARVRFAELPALASLRPNLFDATECSGAGEILPLAVPAGDDRTIVRSIEAGERGALDVSEANIVVSGGRGMQDPANWAMLEDLVDALGPESTLGASRAVVDAGWRPHAEQVGQTGKVVSPNLYFAVGISGAIQHLAGMRTAKVIVAVNRDPEAPIFSVANYGIVGDASEVVPALASAIREMRDGRA